METPLVLVLNAGSSSLKGQVLAFAGSEVRVCWRDQTPWQPQRDGQAVLSDWLAPALEPWRRQISLVGHRVVHGGERFSAPTRLDGDVLAELEALVPLAPLHNPPALQVMRWLAQTLPDLEQWACFDTAFHATLPPEAHTYAIPQAWRQQGLRRYGFHGLNHQHVAETVCRLQPEAQRLISCHLGAGCSLAAIELQGHAAVQESGSAGLESSPAARAAGPSGRSVATTMGFTPLEGLVMATRSGSLDPGLLLHQLRHGWSAEELDRVLQAESGLLGLSGLSADMRELRRAAAEGHAGARLAIAVFQHRLLAEIGAMAACLGGVDVLALTGGIGEHDLALRDHLAERLAWLGSPPLVVVPADEEGLIARQCLAAARG